MLSIEKQDYDGLGFPADYESYKVTYTFGHADLVVPVEVYVDNLFRKFWQIHDYSIKVDVSRYTTLDAALTELEERRKHGNKYCKQNYHIFKKGNK